MKSIIDSTIQEFSLNAYHNGKFITVTSDDMIGRWTILFFYLNDFCFVCPTELADMADIYDELQEMGTEVYGISPDSHYAHKAWHDSSPSINKIKFPMLSDRTGKLAKDLHTLSPESGIIRSTFLISPEGKVKLAEYHERGIGRDAAELLRKVKEIVRHYSCSSR